MMTYVKFGGLSVVAIALALVCFSCKKDEPEGIPATQEETQAADSKKKVLVELFTNVSCGACPRAHYYIKEVEKANENVIHMTHYLKGPMNVDYTEYVRNNVKSIQFTPHAIIQRRQEDGNVLYYPPEDYENISTEELDQEPLLTINLSAQNDEGMFKLNIENVAADDFDAEEIRLTAILVEKSVVGDDFNYHQRNYGNNDPNHPYYQQGDYLIGFEHTNVPRRILTTNEGDLIELKNKKASLELSDDLSDLTLSNFAVIVFATRISSHEIINAQYLDLTDL